MEWGDEPTKVIRQVANRLAAQFRWATADDLEQEARILVATTNVLTGATTMGAFHKRLRLGLIDAHKTEARQRKRTVATFDGDGNVVTGFAEDGSPFMYVGPERHSGKGQRRTFDDQDVARWRGTDDPDWDSSQDEATKRRERWQARSMERWTAGRSQLLDRLGSMSKDEFYDWGCTELGRAWRKREDLHAVLYGSSAEKAELWEKYVRGKRSDLQLGPCSTPMDRDERLEEWRARYRWRGDRRASKINVPVGIMSHDGAVVVTPTYLRTRTRA